MSMLVPSDSLCLDCFAMIASAVIAISSLIIAPSPITSVTGSHLLSSCTDYCPEDVEGVPPGAGAGTRRSIDALDLSHRESPPRLA